MNTSEDTNRHTLPSLSQIMPPPQQNDSTSPIITNGYYTQQPQQTQHQSGYIDPYSQISTAQTTPTNSYTGFDNTHNNNSVVQQSSNNSPSDSTSTNSQLQCICKTNPNKIPRPRNAFILFRQKFHQTVLDEGTVIRTNPEVSRELGKRWRSLNSIEKQHWNNLAEEEKKNHELKYPGYKYAPRRNGKNKNCLVCKDKPSSNTATNQKQLAKEQLKANRLAAKKQAQQIQQQQQINLQRHHSEAAIAASNALLVSSTNQSSHLQTQDIFKAQVYNNGNSNFIYPPQPFHYSTGNNNGSLSAASTTSSSSTTNLPLPNNYNYIQQQAQQQQPTSTTSLTSMQFYDHDKLSPLSHQQQGQQQQDPQQQQQQQHYASHLSSNNTAGPVIVDYQANVVGGLLHPQQHHQPFFQTAPPPPISQHNTGTYGFDNFHQ
ncbi:RFG1 [Candida jiufengensis]|uniref:RFG1 n=1 Tax=Candida jiufengensis TaxID=497108 RepID=UPI0022258C13|nr:RFG1 [Candida jiufengensis]KAI5950831.1 RFG1 [Candida jiufengensis]